MITIVIKKFPSIRLFDPMPLPKPKNRQSHFFRKYLRKNTSSNISRPFFVKINRIKCNKSAVVSARQTSAPMARSFVARYFTRIVPNVLTIEKRRENILDGGC